MSASNKQYVGINYQTETPYAFIGKAHWNVRKDGVTEKVNNQLLDLFDKFLAGVAKKRIGDREAFDMHRKMAREILELTLEKFSWTKSANDPNIGPALLGDLAIQVKDFLLSGGKHGKQRLPTG